MVVSSPDLKAFLRVTPFFGGLSDASLDLLMSMLVECRFEDGNTVVAEGKPGHSMFIVYSGKLVVSIRPPDASMTAARPHAAVFDIDTRNRRDKCLDT